MKIKELQKILENKKINIALLYNLDFDRINPNFSYLSQYNDIGFLVVPKKKKPFLLLPKIDYLRYKNKGIQKIPLEKKTRALEQISSILKKKGIKTKSIGLDYSMVSLKLMKAIRKGIKGKYLDISSQCDELRKIKTDPELKKLKKACETSDKVMQGLIKEIKGRKIKTEKQAEKFLLVETVKNGCEMSFDPIIASGKMASIPHYKPTEVKFRKGFCVIDYGACYEGYKADMTRTIYFGKPSKKEIDIYNKVLNCQETIIKEVRKGDRCDKIYLKSVELLGEYKDKFIHGLGHGIGLKIHELPSLSVYSKEIISEGDIFTVEPGVYFKNKLGIRIEDDVVITGGKAKLLTKTTKKLITI